MRPRVCTRVHAYVWAWEGMRAHACTRVHACAHLFAGLHERAHVGMQMCGCGFGYGWVCGLSGDGSVSSACLRVRGRYVSVGGWIWVGVGECGRVWVRVWVGGRGCGLLWDSVPWLVGGGWVRVGASEC